MLMNALRSQPSVKVASSVTTRQDRMLVEVQCKLFISFKVMLHGMIFSATLLH